MLFTDPDRSARLLLQVVLLALAMVLASKTSYRYSATGVGPP